MRGQILMKGAWSIVCVGFLSVCAFAYETEARRYLSYIYQEKFSLDRLYNHHQASVMRWQNLSPLDLGFSDSYNYAYSPTLKSRGFYVGISQPIFKSGGIWKSIQYANANEAYNAKGIDIEERALVANVLVLLAQLKKLGLELERQNLLIENASIDVQRKKEQYEAGFIDSSMLDNAILDKNQAQKQLIELRSTQNAYRHDLSKLSDIEDESMPLPPMPWVNEDDYLQENWQIQYAQLNYAQKGVLYWKSLSDFLPQVSLQARYNKDLQNNNVASPATIKDSYSTITLNVSLPLFDAGIYDKMQGAKVEELRSSLQIAQTKREQQSLYRKQILEKQFIEQKRNIAKDDIKLYTSLLEDSMGRFRAGDLTDHDVQIMQNSKKIRELELNILDYEEKLLYLELYRNIQER